MQLRAIILLLLVGAVAAAEPLPDGRYTCRLEGALELWRTGLEPHRPRRGEAPPAQPYLVLERRDGAWLPGVAGRSELPRSPRSDARGLVAGADDDEVTVVLQLGGLPRKRDWLKKSRPAPARFRLRLAAAGQAPAGTWEGEVAGATASGKLAVGRAALASPALPAPPDPPAPGEHPRFLIRAGDIPALRERLATPRGRALREHLERSGRSRSDSAVALGLLWRLTGERAYADRARELFANDIKAGWWTTLGPIHDPAHRVTAAVLAYDLVHDACDADFHRWMRGRLRFALRHLYDYAEINSGNGHPRSNWSAQYRGAVALASLALLADPAASLPEPPPAWRPPAIEAPADLAVPAGVPVLPYGAAPLRAWLFCGPMNIGLGHDGLAALGGEAAARPVPGASFTAAVKPEPRRGPLVGKHAQVILFKNARPKPRNRDVLGDDLQPLAAEAGFAFGPVPEHAVVFENEYRSPEGWIQLWRAAGLAGFQTLYFYAVIDNPAPRTVQVHLDGTGTQHDWKHADSALWISGRRFEHADVLHLGAGRHPVLRKVTVSCPRDAHGRYELFGEVFLTELDAAAVDRAVAVRETEREFRAAAIAALAPRWEELGRPDLDALLWYGLARESMEIYAATAIGRRGWHSAGQCYTQHPLLVALPVAHALRRATGSDLAGAPHLGWFLGQAAQRTVFAADGARMQDYGRGGGPVGVDLFGRGFGLVPTAIRPGVARAWRRTLELTRAGDFDSPDLAITELDPMSAAFTLVNWPGDVPAADGPNPPLAVADPDRQAYGMRDRYRDGDDIVASITGFRHPGGDWPCEGARLDVRLQGLGAVWLAQGGKPRETDAGLAPLRSALNTVDILGARSEPLQVTARDWRPAADGSATLVLDYPITAGDHDRPGRGRRCFGIDYSGASGAAALLVLTDRIDFAVPEGAAWPGPPPEARTGPGLDETTAADDELGGLLDDLAEEEEAGPVRPHRWRLVTMPGHRFERSSRGFRLHGPDRAVLDVVVLVPEEPVVTERAITYGKEVNYRYDHQGKTFDRRLITLTMADTAVVVMTLTRGDPPPVRHRGDASTPTITVGEQTIRVGEDGIRFEVFGE